MKRDVEYYKELWLQKSGQKPYEGKKEDIVHAWFLNRLFSPAKHDRHSVAGELMAEASGRLLDIGCWGGESLRKMGAFDKFAEVFGVDLIEESLERARALGIKTALCNLNEAPLPFSDNCFDVVTCIAVIGQVFDPYHMLNEIHRVLKRGGFVILGVRNVASLSNRVRLLLGRMPVTSCDPGWDGGQLHYFTLYETKHALKSRGFIVRTVRASGAGQAMRQLWPALLSGTLTLKAVKQ